MNPLKSTIAAFSILPRYCDVKEILNRPQQDYIACITQLPGLDNKDCPA